MKQWILLLALALLLTGCGGPDVTPSTGPSIKPGETEPTQSQTTPSTEPVEPTTPEAPVEDHGLSMIDLGKEYDAVAGFGHQILLFSGNELSLWTVGAENPEAVVEIDGLPRPETGCFRVVGGQILYFDSTAKTLVYLDGSLKEQRRLTIHEEMRGSPWLSQDGSMLYFCDSQGLRVWDFDKGICRNLKIQPGKWLGINGSLLSGTALRCQLEQEDGSVRTVLVSTENGQTLYEGEKLEDVTGSGNFYCYVTENEWVFGVAGEQPQLLNVPGAVPLPEIQGALTYFEGGQLVILNLFDLSTGRQTATIRVMRPLSIQSVFAFDGYIWILGQDQLWRWDPSRYPVKNEQDYAENRYTVDDPDTEGLAALKDRAEALGKPFGVEILLWKDVALAEPADYHFGIEYRTEVFAQALDILEQAFGKLPGDLLSRAADWNSDKTLHIVLASGISTPSDGPYAQVAGMEYLLDGKVYIVLDLGETLEQEFYHTLFHVIDPVILSNSIAYYKWNDLNPTGFRYDNDYIKNLNRDEKQYLGDNRYFIDIFSMSFAVEDRAQIFAYAMMEGNEGYFTSTAMQKKLKMLCNGLKDVFDLEGKTYAWGQYLK